MQQDAPVAENTNVVFRICAETKFYSAGDYYCPEKYLEIEEREAIPLYEEQMNQI